MASIDSIFKEYMRLRTNGLQATEAVSALHPYIGSLDAKAREELAAYLRAWEHNRTQPELSAEERSKMLAIAQLQRAQAIVLCPNCEAENAAHEVICYSCGMLLYPQHYMNSTTNLPPKTDELIDQAHFDKEDVLVLVHQESGNQFEVQPQLVQYDVKVGRGAEGEPYCPDINLGKLDDGALGVSRFHATIRYDRKTETLQLFDMDSTNGTFVNNQRLHANERRVLRHGDKIRFGRLEVWVSFQSG